eukprot:scaffold38511_cov37-Tisochrysis_lutea.AAC.1
MLAVTKRRTESPRVDITIVAEREAAVVTDSDGNHGDRSEGHHTEGQFLWFPVAVSQLTHLARAERVKRTCDRRNEAVRWRCRHRHNALAYQLHYTLRHQTRAVVAKCTAPAPAE